MKSGWNGTPEENDCLKNCEEDDKKLVQICKSGNNEAFEILYNKYKIRIFRLCNRMLQNRQEAEDATEETFLRAFKYIKKFKEKSSFFTWLYTIAMNHCKNIIKNRERRGRIFLQFIDFFNPRKESLPEQELATTDLNPEKPYDDKELSDCIEKAMGELNADQRAAVIAVHFEGLSYKEAAKILGCPINTLRTRLHRGLEKLMEKLKDCLEER